MEQITFREWTKEQLKKAPSFTISLALLALILIVSSFIEYAPPLISTPIGEEYEIVRLDDPVLPFIEKTMIKDKPDIGAPVAPVPVTDSEFFSDPEIEQADFSKTQSIDIEINIDNPAVTPVEPLADNLRAITVTRVEDNLNGLPPGMISRTTGSKRTTDNKYIGKPLARNVNQSIISALRWLKNSQESDGSWSSPKWQGGGMTNEGGTAMALLCFLGYGCTDREPSEFANTVKKAAEFLVTKQQPTGSWGGRFYEQGIITLAMCEAAAMMPRNTKIKEAATKGIEFIAKNAGPDGGFSYGGPGNDNSVTIFQLQALKAAITAGISVPPEFKKKAENWLTMCVAGDGSTSYRPAACQQGGGSVSMTAAALTARLLLGESRSGANAKAQAEWLAKANYVTNGQPAANNSYIVYYLSLSMFQMGDKYWTDWRDAYMKTLMDKQERQGPTAGSWPTKVCQWGGSGGRIYTTAFSCLALEAAYRYERKK